MNKRLLILTADAGFGHRSASNAVGQAFTLLHGAEGEVFIVNPVFDNAAPAFIRKSQQDYDHTVVQNPVLYSFSYKISDSIPASMMVNATMRVLLNKTMGRIVEQYQPDYVLSTFHFYQSALAPILRAQPRLIPFFSVVTDLADVHQLWFEGSPDILFVPTESVRKQALSSGLPEQRVVLSGMPVDTAIAMETRPKEEIRVSLGLEPDLPVVLVVSSNRVRRDHLEQLLQSVNCCGKPFQLAVISGGDSVLFADLNRINWNIPVHVFEYTRSMPAFMRASDLLVSKAGGLITSEALACGLPILLIENLPGQEEGNMRFLCREKAALAVSDPASFSREIDDLFSNQQSRLKEMAANASRIGKPEAAFTIAETIWQTAANEISNRVAISRHSFRNYNNDQRSQRISQ